MNTDNEIVIDNYYRGPISDSEMKVIKLLGKCVLRALKSINNSNVKLLMDDNTIIIDKYKTNIIVFRGGLNGNGKWRDYFVTLANFVNILEKEYGISAWLISLKNDCEDDVFNATFGFKFDNNLSNNKDIDNLIKEFWDIIRNEEIYFLKEGELYKN